jgi:uncharacterized protein YlxW (UPF0749 family)
MRWPTTVEQGVGVLLLLFLASACMAALAVGLGSNWVVNVLLYALALWNNTFKAALHKAKSEEVLRKKRDEELDALLNEKAAFKRRITALEHDLDQQTQRTDEEKRRRERDKAEYERLIASLSAELDKERENE